MVTRSRETAREAGRGSARGQVATTSQSWPECAQPDSMDQRMCRTHSKRTRVFGRKDVGVLLLDGLVHSRTTGEMRVGVLDLHTVRPEQPAGKTPRSPA